MFVGWKVWCKTLVKVDWDTPLIDLYANYPWGDLWAEGDLLSVVRYLRGSKKLKLPNEWRSVLPEFVVDEPMED